MTYLKPHSPQWFKALKQQNPQFAMMAEQMVVEVAQTKECCTFCGDTAEDSELQDYIMLPNAENPKAFTFKMCPDCVKIRGKQYGEKFRPLTD